MFREQNPDLQNKGVPMASVLIGLVIASFGCLVVVPTIRMLVSPSKTKTLVESQAVTFAEG